MQISIATARGLINYDMRINHASIGAVISGWLRQLANLRNKKGHHHD
ncbi:MAG: hypothetical protein WA635_12860 [Gallionella sp.]